MKKFLKILGILVIGIELIAIALLLPGCSEKVRRAEKSDVKKETQTETIDLTETTIRRTLDSILRIQGSTISSVLVPTAYDWSQPADSLETVVAENDRVKVTTTRNKKTGKIQTKAEVKDQAIPVKIQEETTTKNNIRKKETQKSDSSGKKKELKKKPAEVMERAVDRWTRTIEVVCIFALVIFSLFFGIRYLASGGGKTSG